jgi:aminoglycoside 3-N-acetyltransferase
VVAEEDWPTIRQHLPGFDPAVTPSQGMGAIAEHVRTWPGAKRSGHPQTSFAAVGRLADVLLAGHQLESPLGDQSPLARLEDADARVLLLGVGMNRNTSFHLAECRLPRAPRRTNGCAIADGSDRRWVTYQSVAMNDGDFGQLGKAFEAETTQVAVGDVGDAPSRLFSVRPAVAYALSWLQAHRGPT